MKRQRLAVLLTWFLALTACGNDIDKLVITTTPVSQRQGEILSALTVHAFDRAGKRVSGGEAVTLTVSEGELGGPSVSKLIAGSATFSELHVDTAATGLTLTAKAGGRSVISEPFDITGIMLVLDAPPSGLLSGDAFTLSASFRDVETRARVSLTREVTLRADGGTLSGPATQTSVDGVATFAGVSVESTGTPVTLTAVALAADEATVGPFDVSPLVLAFSGVDAVGVPDTLGPYGVRLTDGTGTILRGAQRIVTLTGAPALGGTTSTATSDGIAMFDDVFVVASGSVMLTASAAGAAPITATVRLSFSGTELELPDKSTVTNDTPATAEPLSPGVPVFGSLQTPSDVDVYRFHAMAGQRLEVASYGVRMDQAAFNGATEIELMASDGRTRMQLVNAAALDWPGLDSGLREVLIPADGDYFVSIAVEAGGAGGHYALEVWLRDAEMPLERELYGFWSGEPDVYRVAIDAPARVRAQITAQRNGWYATQTDQFDSVLIFQDAAGVALWSNNDTTFHDAGMDFLVTVSGDYFLRVDRCCGTGASPYFLSYATEPAAPKTATDIGYGDVIRGTSAGTEAHLFRFMGIQGDAVRVLSLASNLSSSPPATALLNADGTTLLVQHASSGAYRSTQAIIPATAAYCVRVISGTPGDWAFSLERVEDSPWEVEPNSAAISAGTPAEMNAIANNGRIAGVINPAGDHDNFSFSAHAGQLVSVDLHGGPGRSDGAPSFSSYGSSLVPSLAIVDARGTMLASTTSADSGPYAQSLNRPLAMLSIAFRAPADGTYYVIVSDTQVSGGEDHTYWLQLRRNQ